MDLAESDRVIQGTFIRAPKISQLAKNIDILAKLNGESGKCYCTRPELFYKAVAGSTEQPACTCV